MARIKQTDKLLSIQEKMRQLQAQAAAIEARQKEQERKDDTRRKVIAGALALEHLAANPQSEFASVLNRLLDEYVKRPADRALFASLADAAPGEAGNTGQASGSPRETPNAFADGQGADALQEAG